MRHKLKAYHAEKREFQAVIKKIGGRKNKPEKKTVLLENLTLAGDPEILTDHLWLDYHGGLKNFHPGERIIFKAKVICYKKNFAGDPLQAQDYGLAGIHKVRKAENL